MKSLLLGVPLSSLLFVTVAAAQSAPTKDKEPSRPPQVRTYSTVTVVDDPSKAPRLPTQKQTAQTAKDTPPPPAKGPNPTPKDPSTSVVKEPASPSAETGPAPRTDPKSAATGAASTDRKNIEVLRQDLRSTARELRETGKREPVRDPAAPTPTQKRPSADPTPAAESRREHRLRQLLQERAGRDN